MGKYTDLARKLPAGPQEGGEVLYSNNVNINNIYSGGDSGVGKPVSARPEDTLQGSPPVEMRQGVADGAKGGTDAAENRLTNLRTTKLTNLIGGAGEEVWVAAPPKPRYTNLARRSGAAVRCIHDTTPDACQVCNGYARWLIADPDRLRRAQARPEEVRREFWRSVRGGRS